MKNYKSDRTCNKNVIIVRNIIFQKPIDLSLNIE